MAQVYGSGPEFRGAVIPYADNGGLLEIPGGIGPHTVPDWVTENGLLLNLDDAASADPPVATTSLWTAATDVSLPSLAATDKRVLWSANQYTAPDFSSGWTSYYSSQPFSFAFSTTTAGLPPWITVARRATLTTTGNVSAGGAAQFGRGAITGSGASLFGMTPAVTHTKIGAWMRLVSKSAGVGNVNAYLQVDYNTDSTFRNATFGTPTPVLTLPASGEWVYVQSPLVWEPHVLANNCAPIIAMTTTSALSSGESIVIEFAQPTFQYWQGVATRDLGSGVSNIPNPRAASNTTSWGVGGLNSLSSTSQALTNHPGGATTAFRMTGTTQSEGYWASPQGSAGSNASIATLTSAGKRRVSPGDVIYFRTWVRRNEADASVTSVALRAYTWAPDGTWLADSNALNFVTLPQGQWMLLSGSYTVPAGAGWLSFAARFACSTGVAADASITQFQESNAPIVDYWDGDTPGASWYGTANASKSAWKGTGAEWTVTNTASSGVSDPRNVWTPNAVADPNFAGSLAGWGNFGTNVTKSFQSITNDGADGASTCIQFTGTWSTTGTAGQVIEPVLGDTKGSLLLAGYTHFTVSWWLKVVSVTGGSLTFTAVPELVVMSDTNVYIGAQIGTSTPIEIADGWKFYTWTFTASTVAGAYPTGRRVGPRVRMSVNEAAPSGATMVVRVGGMSIRAWDGQLVTPDIPTVAAVDDASNGNFVIEADSGYSHLFGSAQAAANGPTRLSAASIPYIAPGTTKLRVRKLAPNVGTTYKAWRRLP